MLRSHANLEVQELNTFQANEALKDQQQSIQQQQTVKLFKCPFENCNKILRSKKSLKDHCRIHTGQKPYICTWPGCTKKFIQYSSFQKHQRVHQNEKPYQCPYEDCGKCFSQISNLRRHLRIHTNEKPFFCEICKKCFNTSSNLKQHQEVHKEKKERKAFFCPFCGKEYLYQTNLNKHLRLNRCENINKIQANTPNYNNNSLYQLFEEDTNSSVDALFLQQCLDQTSKSEKLTQNLEFFPLNEQQQQQQSQLENLNYNSNIEQFLSFDDCKLFINEQEINYDQISNASDAKIEMRSQLNQ